MNQSKGDYLLGNADMYRFTGENKYKDYVFCCVNPLIADDGTLLEPLEERELPILFFLYDETRKEKFRRAVEKQVGKANQESLEIQPFLAEYETQCRNKEGYEKIVRRFQNHTNYTVRDMVILADTAGQISEEIFEHYKALQELLKMEIKRKLTVNLQGEEKTAFCFVILKACNMRTVLREKYQSAGFMIWESLVGQEKEDCGECNNTGMWLRCRAQYEQIKK